MTHGTSYLYWDNTEAVTVITKTNSAGSTVDTETSITIAKRGSQQRNETQFNGILISSEDQFWLIPSALLIDGSSNDLKLHEGDRIKVSDSEQYTIQSTKLIRNGSEKSHWRCLTKTEV